MENNNETKNEETTSPTKFEKSILLYGVHKKNVDDLPFDQATSIMKEFEKLVEKQPEYIALEEEIEKWEISHKLYDHHRWVSKWEYEDHKVGTLIHVTVDQESTFHGAMCIC